jgi:hypothetical protein
VVLVPRPGVVPAPVRRTLLYREATGRLPPLLRPRTFTEKLNWRITFDRRDLLAPTCDKLAMKEHARRLTPGLVRVPTTLWSGTDVGELADVDLPGHWVLKPNHSCIRRLFGQDPADVADLRRRTAGRGGEQYWRKSEEWAYRRARPCLLVEEFVGVPGMVPADLKVLVVGGEPRLVELHTGRGDDHRARFYDPEWRPLPWTVGYRPGPDADPPERLEDLLKAATALADGFDMLRVDCYEVDGELWFGELTPYPGAGLSPLEPDLDAWLGAAWTLPPLRRTRG